MNYRDIAAIAFMYDREGREMKLSDFLFGSDSSFTQLLHNQQTH